jgi:hypothetical protein
MKISSAGKALSRTTARNSFLINQLATPGLGSLMAGRYVAGSGQLLLALAGFGLVLAWFIALLTQMYQQIESDTQPKSVAWLGELGALIFAAAWLWALITSLSLVREAGANEAQPKPPIPLGSGD